MNSRNTKLGSWQTTFLNVLTKGPTDFIDEIINLLNCFTSLLPHGKWWEEALSLKKVLNHTWIYMNYSLFISKDRLNIKT